MKECKCTTVAGIHCKRNEDGTYTHYCGGIVQEQTCRSMDKWYEENPSCAWQQTGNYQLIEKN